MSNKREKMIFYLTGCHKSINVPKQQVKKNYNDTKINCDTTLVYQPCSYLLMAPKQRKTSSKITNNIKNAKSLVNLSLFNTPKSSKLQRKRAATIP